MENISFVDTPNPQKQIIFRHLKHDAVKGTWKKERKIFLDNIKINIFVEGDFSVIVNDQSHSPSFGDICILPPHTMHCGCITKPTHLDYYQLDMGINALDNVPGGLELTQKLLSAATEHGWCIKPADKTKKELVKLCDKLHSSVISKNTPLSFAYTIRLIDLLNEAVSGSVPNSDGHLSFVTKNTINTIIERYGENLTLPIIAEENNISPSYLSRIFKKETGISVHKYLLQYRIIQSTYLLKTHTVAEVANICGFSDSSHFISVFAKEIGCTPTAFIRGINQA